MEDYRARIRELKEENKRVKERADDNKSELRKEIKHLNEMIYKFEEENRKLREELYKRNKLVKYYRNEKKNLREKVKELKKDYISTREEWLNTD